MQVPEKDKKLMHRYGHGAAAVTISSNCVEVILFGGQNNQGLFVADLVVLRFGKFIGVVQVVQEPHLVEIMTVGNELLIYRF